MSFLECSASQIKAHHGLAKLYAAIETIVKFGFVLPKLGLLQFIVAVVSPLQFSGFGFRKIASPVLGNKIAFRQAEEFA